MGGGTLPKAALIFGSRVAAASKPEESRNAFNRVQRSRRGVCVCVWEWGGGVPG